MRKVALLLGGLLIGCALIAGAQDAMDVQTALGYFVNEAVMITYDDAGRAVLEEIIETFRTALGVPDELDEVSEEAVGDFVVSTDDKQIVNHLSQAYYTLANAFLGGADNEEETYLKGKHWGMKSLRMNPDFLAIETAGATGFVDAVAVETDIMALYWTAANWLRAGEFNPIAAVVAGIPAKTDAMSRRCLELDDTYVSYGSYRALGAFWAGLPRMPVGTWRKNFNRSLGYFCRIVDEPELCAECNDCPDFGGFAPEADLYLENRMLFANYYLKEKGYWEDIKRICEEVLAEPIGDMFPLYNAISHETAQALLEEANE
ncbi:MAG: hypothetical protein JSW65_06175, partial [Candidatus Bipolaricaulota bacterium]